VNLVKNSGSQAFEKRLKDPERRRVRTSFVEVSALSLALLGLAATFARSATAETPPSPASISQDDIQHITRVIGTITNKPILMIASVLEDSYVRGAVTGNAYELNTNTGKRTPKYIRTDLVSVYMPYTDRSHVDVYIVRKVRGRWKIEAKKDWFL